MWTLVIFVIVIGSGAEAQNGRGPPPQDHGHGWDIRLAVPGEPGSDYPTLGSIPRTSFSCAGKEPGYYADVETGCQVFRICTVGSTYGFQSFLCPNGTLFNQDVFVCDWWMNVKCQRSRLVSAHNDMFGNLRLGPQLMKDIKKMLTHPMRNPYDKTSMRSNLIVMQDYKPPAGQLFPNSALIAGPDRPPNNIYVPAKQNFQSYSQNDIAFAASTPDTRYIPAGFTNRPLDEDAEIFQRQRQSAQYVQNSNVQTTQHSEIGNLVANGHAPQFIQHGNSAQINNAPRSRQNENFNQANVQYTQSQRIHPLPTQTSNTQNIPRGQLNRQRAQFIDIKKLAQSNGGKQNEIVSYTKQQYNQEKQPYTYRPPILPLPSERNVNGNNEVKQNLVSSDVPSTVITKTLTYSKVIQDPKPGRPKSRVTVKTWIVKPKSARLVAEPTSYFYDKPTQPPKEKLVVEETSPYVYTRPTKPPQSERIIKENNPRPYVYERPTTSPQSQRVVEEEPKPYTYNRPSPSPPPSPQSEKLQNDDEPYVYDRPTVASKQIFTTRSEPSRTYVPPTQTPTRPRATQAARLILSPPTLPTTKASRLYLVPTTFKPAARLYLPPDPEILARQYLPSSDNSQSGQLRAAPANPTNTTRSSTEAPNSPPYSVVKQSRINTNHNNLTFTDILTKEKLDITVNDIVKDTGKILQTASSPQFGQYRQDVKAAPDYPDDTYLPAEQDESGEKLTSQNPTATTPFKSSRLISQPARSLELPVETPSNNQNSNILSNLPFFQDPSFPNTIERTVSLKITIPEKVASYLFKGGNRTDFDRLEILNTGSSNYLVLSNNLLNPNLGSSIPIDAVLESKKSNISNPQALVFSFLADSLNAAKEYSNLVKQDVITAPSTPAPQFENLNNEALSQITNKVSQLTSSHFSGNNFNAANIAQTTTRPTSATQRNQENRNTQANQQSQAQKQASAQYYLAPSLQSQRQILSQFQADNNILNTNLLDTNQNQIYSGQLYQLPVPEVTNHIYNRPPAGNNVRTNLEQSTATSSSPQTTKQNNDAAARNNLIKQSSAEVEIVQSQTLPLNPVKLQLETANEPESFYSQESLDSLLNSDNGISAQLQDKIVGTIPHPLEDNKVLTYEKDQSYYLYTKFDRGQNVPLNAVDKVTSIPSVITFQFVPSVSYQLEDEKDQQQLLNTFNIDEFGSPRSAVRANLVQGPGQRGTLTSSIDYSVEHPQSPKQESPISALYKGPSSYSAPQGSIGSLSRQIQPPNLSARLERLNENFEGYPKTTPMRRFVF